MCNLVILSHVVVVVIVVFVVWLQNVEDVNVPKEMVSVLHKTES